jgi:phage FluMu protein Com
MGKVTITWRETGEEVNAKELSSAEIPSKEVATFCFDLAGPGHCTDILVNGVSEYDYFYQRKSVGQGNDDLGMGTHPHKIRCPKCKEVMFSYKEMSSDVRQQARQAEAEHKCTTYAHLFEASVNGGDTTKIFVWPDGSWVEASEYCEAEHNYKGDDYYTLDIPDDKLGDMDEDIDAYIDEHGQG